MPKVLAISPNTPHAVAGRAILGDRINLEISNDPAGPLSTASARVFDLLVLCGMAVDAQQDVVTAFHGNRRWRLVPVLYALDPNVPGMAIPGTFRPEMDGLVRGTLETPDVQRRILSMARDGVAEAELVVAGPFELDPIRSVFRLPDLEVGLTEREAEILAILLAQPNRTVSAAEIIERGWGTEANARYLQILRRHVSNIRRKLERTAAARSVRTVRGAGYRFDVKLAG
jgi:DNA-binding winged helix-turn-helix (wHTH) protein